MHQHHSSDRAGCSGSYFLLRIGLPPSVSWQTSPHSSAARIDTLVHGLDGKGRGRAMQPISYAHHRFLSDVIRHAVWIYPAPRTVTVTSRICWPSAHYTSATKPSSDGCLNVG